MPHGAASHPEAARPCGLSTDRQPLASTPHLLKSTGRKRPRNGSVKRWVCDCLGKLLGRDGNSSPHCAFWSANRASGAVADEALVPEGTASAGEPSLGQDRPEQRRETREWRSWWRTRCGPPAPSLCRRDIHAGGNGLPGAAPAALQIIRWVPMKVPHWVQKWFVSLKAFMQKGQQKGQQHRPSKELEGRRRPSGTPSGKPPAGARLHPQQRPGQSRPQLRSRSHPAQPLSAALPCRGVVRTQEGAGQAERRAGPAPGGSPTAGSASFPGQGTKGAGARLSGGPGGRPGRERRGSATNSATHPGRGENSTSTREPLPHVGLDGQPLTTRCRGQCRRTTQRAPGGAPPSSAPSCGSRGSGSASGRGTDPQA